MRILFMGTPDFALFTLRALVESGEDVIGVVTQPDKPVGRKQILTPPPVKETALQLGLPVYQPRGFKNGKATAAAVCGAAAGRNREGASRHLSPAFADS